MKGIVLGLYNDFQCIAGKCTSTCCAGWKIVVDNEAFRRFESIQDANLREDILSNICETDGVKHFVNRSGGRCSMLDGDGLCRIQKNAGEEMLCNTCRKFPRLISKHNGLLWVSMAASCPVVADYIVNSKPEFYMISNKGDILLMDVQNIPFIADEIKECTRLLKKYISGSRTEQDYINIYKLSIDLADSILEVIVENKEIRYLEGSFDYFEDEKSALQVVSQFSEFDNIIKEKYILILENYLQYRIFTRYLEKPEESKRSRLSQAYGELVLICLTALSRHYTIVQKKDDKDRWEIIINWVYRLCVHSFKLGARIHELFTSIRWL